MHPDRRKLIPIFLLVVIIGAGLWYFGSERVNSANGDLSASGTIEARQVVIAAELGGRITQILPEEGETVLEGQTLIKLDDSLHQAQLAQAQSALAQAEANYDLVATGPSAEQREVMISAAELELINAEQALEDLNEKAELMAAQALQDIAVADDSLDNAKERLANLQAAADTPDVDAAWASVVLAKDRLDKASEDFEPYEKKPADNVQRALYQSRLADAQNHYDTVVTRYNNLVGTANRFEMALAEAAAALAEAQLNQARLQYEKVKDGPDPDALVLAEARISTAKANRAAALADPSPEQLATAQSQVDVAKAALQVVQSQMEKLTIYSPLDGVVISRSIEPGETVLPGAPLLTIGQLDDLTITVYISEDRYGLIDLGGTAIVTVDSFPGESFSATVVRIADQAEFTPRNVQTEEGRKTTVYAVKLSVENPDGKLKPGMPADVVFEMPDSPD